MAAPPPSAQQALRALHLQASSASVPSSKPALRPASKRPAQAVADVQQDLAEATQRLADAARDVVRLAQLACQRSAGGEPGPAVVAAARVLNGVKLAQGPVQVHACRLRRQLQTGPHPVLTLAGHLCTSSACTAKERARSSSQQPASAAVHASRQPGSGGQVTSSRRQVAQPQQAWQPRQAGSRTEQCSSPGDAACSPDASAEPSRRQTS